MVQLSLAMIVRDEAHHLPELLGRVLPHVDEAVVVDTGSTDRTLDVLREHGIEPIEIEWPGSFATARNEALARCRGEWILALDADERLSESELSSVRDTIDSAADGVGGFIFKVRNHTDDFTAPNWVALPAEEAEAVGARGYVPATVVRLFRSGPTIRYVGRIHELIEPSLTEAGHALAEIDVTIEHFLDPRLDHPAGGKPARYLGLLEAKVRDEPKSAKAHWELGQFHANGGRSHEAVESLERAWAIAPGNREIALALGPALRETGRVRESLVVLEAGRNSERVDPALDFQIGVTLAFVGQEGPALAAFERSRLGGATFPQVYYWIALLSANTDPRGALRSLDILGTICPRFWPADLLSAELHLGLDESDAALARVESAIRSDGRDPGFISALGEFLAKEPGRTLTPELERLASRQAEVGFALVSAWELGGEAERALVLCRSLQSHSGAEQTARLLGGRIAVKMGRLEEAHEDYQELANDEEHAATALYEWSQVEVSRSQLGEAAHLLEQVLTLDPNHTRALVDLAGLHGNSGRLDLARTYLERAAEQDPFDPLVHHNLAVLAALGDPPDVEAAMRHAAIAQDLGHPVDPQLVERLEGASARHASTSSSPRPE